MGQDDPDRPTESTPPPRPATEDIEGLRARRRYVLARLVQLLTEKSREELDTNVRSP